MSKAVLLSIRPKFCELIASGEKTIEVRKTRPKIETPFKCYIYQTKKCEYSRNGDITYRYTTEKDGKVIGEFVCDNIANIVPVSSVKDGHKSYFGLSEYGWRSTCLTPDELIAYGGEYEKLYGWHISDLVIYDKPKELSEFVTEGDCDCMNCAKCAWLDKGNSAAEIEDDCELAYVNVRDGVNLKPIFRAPQSWRYVEAMT